MIANDKKKEDRVEGENQGVGWGWGFTTSSMITMGINPLCPVAWDLPHPHSSSIKLSKRNTSPSSALNGEEKGGE